MGELQKGDRIPVIRAGVFCISVLLLAKAALAADSCEANFKVSGDPRNGASFDTSVTIPGLDMHSALGQLQQIALDGGFKIGAEDYKDSEGELVIARKDSFKVRGYPILLVANNDTGKVSIALRLHRGQMAKAEDMRSFMCGMLSKLKAGEEGKAIAAAARAKTHTDQITDVKAPNLAYELEKAIRFKQSREQIETIEAQYVNRMYRIDGQIYTVSKSRYAADHRELAFVTTRRSGLLGIQESDTNQMIRVSIVCVMAPDQAAYFDNLREQDFATVVGKVSSFDGHSLQLKDCKQGN